MIETVLLGALLRLLQALLQATPTILVGVVVAAVFQRLLGHNNTRKLFGDNSWRSLPQAWLVGMLLPVCSLGVIPVVRELRKAGVPGGAILAFGLTAPLFNPISVLYGLTLANSVVILTFCLCSLVIVTVVGLSWDRLFPGTTVQEEAPRRVAHGWKRILAIAVASARELTSPTMIYIGIGLLGVATLSMILPAGRLQTAAEHTDPWAPLFMAGVAIPAYASPMTAMVQLASMFQHGNSIGAAFALLALGAGANIGLVVWTMRTYSLVRGATWFAILVAVVVLLSYGVDRPLYPQGVEPAGHTHAFDIYCSPFSDGAQATLGTVTGTLTEKIAPHEIVSLALAGCLVLAGVVIQVVDPRREKIEPWLEREPDVRQQYDIILPGPVLGGIALLGLVAMSVFGCYLYYPPPSEIFEEMRIINTEVASAASSQDWDTALYWIPVYDDWTRKLQVSMFLRGEELTPYRRAKSNILRDKLELLEHEVEDQEVEESREIGMAVARAFGRMRTAYLPAHE